MKRKATTPRAKCVIDLHGQTIILGKEGSNTVHPLTDKALAKLGVESAESPEETADRLDVDLIRIRMTRKSADPAPPRRLRDADATCAVQMIQQLPMLFAEARDSAMIMLVLLLGRLWSLFWPEFLPALQIRIIDLPLLPEPLVQLAHLIGGAERWSGDDWQVHLPTRLGAHISFGSACVANRWTDYAYAEIRLRHRTIRLPQAYRDRAVLIESSFPPALQRIFADQNPLAIPVWLNGKCPSRDGVILDLDGTVFFTYDGELYDSVLSCSDDIAAVFELFVHDAQHKKRWKRTLREAFRSFDITDRDGRFIKRNASAECCVKAAMLAVWETLLRWSIEKGLCTEDAANEALFAVWAAILPETCPKLQNPDCVMRLEDATTFIRFLAEYVGEAAITSEWTEGCKAICREVNGEQLLILPREQSVQTLLAWAEPQQIDFSFAKEYKPAELPAKLQRVWSTDALGLLKDGGRDVTWKYGITTTKDKVAALGIRLGTLTQFVKQHGIEIGQPLGQLLSPPTEYELVESEKVPEYTEWEEIDL